MFSMQKMPKEYEAVDGQYAVVRVEATVDRTDDLRTLGEEIARDNNISHPSIQVIPLVQRGNRYLIVVTKAGDR